MVFPWLLAFGAGFFGSIPLTGPIAVLIVARAAERKFAAAVRLGAGAAVAEGIYAGLASWGFALALAGHPRAQEFAHAITSLVLLGVGVRFCFWKDPGESMGDKARDAATRPFVIGFMVSALNPTLLLSWGIVVVTANTHGVTTSRGLLAIPFGASAALGVFAWEATLVGLLRRYERHLPRRAVVWVVHAMGAILVLFAGASAVELLRKT
jgi:threonine/homoserine/homoserine lactone efflux protein